MEQQYIDLVKNAVHDGLEAIHKNIANAKEGEFECLPIDFVIPDEVHLVFGTIVSRLRKSGYTVDITSRKDNITWLGNTTSKYTAIISW